MSDVDCSIAACLGSRGDRLRERIAASAACGGSKKPALQAEIDDLAGKTDQDWREGCAPGDLPDGGGGSSAEIVPRHPAGNRAAASCEGTIGMNKKAPRTEEKIDRHGRGVLLSGRNGWNRARRLPTQRRGSRKSAATALKNARIGLHSQPADRKSTNQPLQSMNNDSSGKSRV
jgi:hypothetical protein